MTYSTENASNRAVARSEESQESNAAASSVRGDLDVLPSEQHQPGHVFPQSQVNRVIGAVEEVYTFADGTEVRHYLQGNPGILEVLVDALPVIQEIFEFSDLAVALTEPTEPGKSFRRELYIRIVTDADVDEALARLRRFDEKWWLDRPPEVRDRICFDIDFQ